MQDVHVYCSIHKIPYDFILEISLVFAFVALYDDQVDSLRALSLLSVLKETVSFLKL